MSTVQEIEAAVSQLSRRELAAFRDWFFEFAAVRDRQFESDERAASGSREKLDYLRREAALGKREDFESFLAAVPRRKPAGTDRPPE